jgi:hypothetical protein
MSVIDDLVLVIVSSDVVVLRWLAFPRAARASHPQRVMSWPAGGVMITEHNQHRSTGGMLTVGGRRPDYRQ